MITEIFKTCLSIDTLDLNLSKIKKECFKIHKQGKSRVYPQMGGFQSPNLELTNPNLLEMINAITDKANFYATDVLTLNKKIKLHNMWLNINGYKDFNLEHTHPNSIISGAFYVSVPKNSGDIYFLNPININNFLSLYLLRSLEDNAVFKQNNSGNCTKTLVPGAEGRLILFPSWLKHGVYPNMDPTKKRISFSFNFM